MGTIQDRLNPLTFISHVKLLRNPNKNNQITLAWKVNVDETSSKIFIRMPNRHFYFGYNLHIVFFIIRNEIFQNTDFSNISNI